MIDIIIADNQVLTREGLKATLSGIIDIKIAGYIAHGAELHQMLTAINPVVVLIDPNYNHRLTAEDITAIRSNYSSARILVLSNRKSKAEITALLDLGIKNYVSKECSKEELVRAIYATAKGEQFFCTQTFEVLFGGKLIAQNGDLITHLSPREKELVYLIADGLTNKEIAEKLFLSVHTIKTHRKNIIKKLGFTFKNVAELAHLLKRA
ncbi:MAG TPA: response regulator transcription factor [Mucilaginibacter sp.]|nr:response regulator transcription factor [Mucilaginibacter sp.]